LYRGIIEMWRTRELGETKVEHLLKMELKIQKNIVKIDLLKME
jgi:hypothetical protein